MPMPHASVIDGEATSRLAFEASREFAGSQRDMIHALLKSRGPMTPEQIGAALNLDAYAVRKRLPELERMGLAAPTGGIAPTASGRQQRIWKAVGSSNGWRRLSDYAIRKGSFVIGKALVRGETVYTLTSDDLSIIERFASADEAKARVEEFLSGNGRPAGLCIQPAQAARPNSTAGRSNHRGW